MELSLTVETENFRRWTEIAIKDLEDNQARKWLETVAFEFLSRVIQKNPVDTGRARGGWASYLIAKGQPVHGGPNLEAWAQGVREGHFRESFESREQFIIITNSVPYIVLLEFGSSRQAPGGMMRITFRELRAEVLNAAMAERLAAMVAQANRTAKVRRMRSRGLRQLPG